MTRTSLVRIAAVAAALAAAPARPSDPPHDDANLPKTCRDCHVLHSATGATLTAEAANALLCKSCHAATANVALQTWNDTDQATPGTGGTSHRWDTPAVNPVYGAVVPSSAIAPHLAAGQKLQCSACHDEHSQAAAPFDVAAPAAGAGRHFLRTANAANGLCVDCHAPWAQPSAMSGSYYTAGTASFSGTTVTGTGTTFAGNVQPGWRIKRLSDPASAWAVVRSVDSSTRITLVAAYTGSAGAGTYVAGKTLSHAVGVPLANANTRAVPVEPGGTVAQVAGDVGVAAGGSTTALVASGKGYTTAVLGQVVRFTSGANAGQTRPVASVSGAQLGWTAALASAVRFGDGYELDADGNRSNDVLLVGAGGTSATGGNVACMSCHGVHYADSSSATHDDRPGPTGDGNLLRRAPAETCVACHPGTLLHSSATTSTKYGTWGTTWTCLTCHQPHRTSNVTLVSPVITTPASGVKDIDLRSITGGFESFGLARLDAPGAGVCEACHTRTRHSAPTTGTTSSFTAGSTTASITGGTLTGLAAGWEVRRTTAPDGTNPAAWTRIATINTTTGALTLVAGGYKGTTGTGAWEAQNPIFRNDGTGRGVGNAHAATSCLTCHSHRNGFRFQ